LGLEALKIAVGPNGILVDEQSRTSVPSIYAIGDVIGPPFLAHAASVQGRRAAAHALGVPGVQDHPVIPTAIFTRPEIGSVGLSEDEARRQGIDVEVARLPFHALGAAHASGMTEGLIKLIGESSTGLIVGAHLIGAHATDLVGFFTLAMAHRLTIHQLAETVLAHPTFSESIMEVAHAWLRQRHRRTSPLPRR